MTGSDVTICPYCGSKSTVKFPCCGYLCMKCGKTYESEDVNDLGENRLSQVSEADSKS